MVGKAGLLALGGGLNSSF